MPSAIFPPAAFTPEIRFDELLPFTSAAPQLQTSCDTASELNNLVSETCLQLPPLFRD